MDEIKEKLISHFAAACSAPFLFVGSGFSRRYLNLDDWSSLLRKFAVDLKPFEYYLASSNGDLPTVASLIAEDFHDKWWSDPKYDLSRERNKAKLKDKTSALRIEICNYLNNIADIVFTETAYPEEVAALSKLNVDGIITTNWDLFLEKLFPDYRVYVGQSELLFSHPQSIAEIYKIHGSASRPSSLVLTRNDYDVFEGKNPYLAAKLITLFVEHPIVFIGYSLTDRNISALLKAIVSCLGGENIEKLRDNLIFVQRAHDKEPSYSKTIIAIDEAQLPITIVKSDDFLPIYEALDVTKRKIPARILRFCKEQLYELVQSTSPESKLSVIDIDNIENSKDVEFVVGVGVAAESTSEFGYQGLTAIDLFKDLILEEERKLDAAKIIESTVPNLSRSCKFLPVYIYLRELGVQSIEECKARGYAIDRHIDQTPAGFKSTIYAKQFIQTEREKTTEEIIASNPPEKAAIFLSFVQRDKFDQDAVRTFLAEHIDKLETANSNYATYFRKAACLYDYYVFGWH
jgi:hypothetical protein